jgi:hypothetical protein
MKRAILFGCLALAVVSMLPVDASTFLGMDQRELLANSDAVVVGRVLQVDSFWNAEHTMIVTEAAVEIQETVVGKLRSSVVTIRTYGGQVESYRIEAHGFPTFSVDDRVLVFLGQDNNNPAAYRVVGYLQGQYQLVRHADGRTTAVPTLDDGVRLLNANGAAAPRPVSQDLDELKAQLRSLDREAVRSIQ